MRAKISAVIFGIFGVFVLANQIKAQQNYNYTNQFLSTALQWDDTATQNQIVIDGLGYTASNGINNGYLFALLNGNYIDQSMKNLVKSNTGKYIKYEDRLKGSLYYSHLFKKAKFHLIFGYQYNNSRNLITTKDAFSIVFEGNTQFENQWANIGNLYFENYQYNQYSIGFMKTVDALEAGINLAVLQGIADQQLKNEKGQLFTAPFGEYLDISHRFLWNQSNGNRFFDLNGIGYSIDLHIAYTFKKFKLAFDVSDLGTITWRKNLMNYQTITDTTVHFEGVSVNLPALINGQSLSLNADTLFNWLGVKKSTTKFVTLLPTTFQFTASVPAKINNTPININLILRTKLLSRYYAWGMVKTNFYLPKNFIVAPSLSAGGYSPFSIGVDVGWQSKHVAIFLGSENLIGSTLPNYYPGSSVYFRLATKF